MSLIEYFEAIQLAYLEGHEGVIETLRDQYKEQTVTYEEAEELGYYILRTATEQFAYLEEKEQARFNMMFRALRESDALTSEWEERLRLHDEELNKLAEEEDEEHGEE